MAKKEAAAGDYSQQDLEASLRIDRNGLDDALIAQPDLYYRVSRSYAMSLSRRDQKKIELEEVRARIDQEIRRRSAKDNEKITEAAIMGRIVLDDQYREASETLNDTNTEMNGWLALRSAYEQRSYALKDLSALYVAGYFGDKTGAGARSEASGRNYEKDKAAMGDERQRRKA